MEDALKIDTILIWLKAKPKENTLWMYFEREEIAYSLTRMPR